MMSTKPTIPLNFVKLPTDTHSEKLVEASNLIRDPTSPLAPDSNPRPVKKRGQLIKWGRVTPSGALPVCFRFPRNIGQGLPPNAVVAWTANSSLLLVGG